MADLVANPLMSPADFAIDVVVRYSQYYGGNGTETMSAASVAGLNSLYMVLDVFASELISALPAHKPEINSCWAASEYFSYMDYIDLFDFALEVWRAVPVASLQVA